MNDKDLMHGDNWLGEDVTGWIVSEKLDGVRAIWTGTQLLTRNGNVIAAPDWFTKDLPQDMVLDCELWAGRGKFTEARLAAQYGKWSCNVRLVIFDSITEGTYKERLHKAAISIGFPMHVNVSDIVTAQSNAHVMEILERVKAKGGEGLIVRKNETPYTAGRSRNVLKIFSPTW